MKTNKQLLGLMLVGALALTSCTQAKNDSTPDTNVTKTTDGATTEDKAIQNLAKNIILPAYQGLSDSAAALHDQVLVLEKNKTQANLNKAQDLWKQTRVYWESTESFLFGPVESLSIDPMIDTWPLNITDLQSILDQGSPITAQVIRTSGANLKGFHTVEFLLFGNGKATNTKDINVLTDREIEYLKATTEILAEDTLRLTTAWTTQYDPDVAGTPSYISLILNPNPDSNPVYNSKQAVIMEFLNGMAGIADEVANGKIAEPLGASAAEADPGAEESPFSWNSITDFSNNIRSIQMMYTGTSMNGLPGVGIKHLLKEKDPVLAEEVEAQIELSIKKIQDIAGPEGTSFGKAILEDSKRVRVSAAQNEVNKLFAMFSQKVLPLMK